MVIDVVKRIEEGRFESEEATIISASSDAQLRIMPYDVMMMTMTALVMMMMNHL